MSYTAHCVFFISVKSVVGWCEIPQSFDYESNSYIKYMHPLRMEGFAV